MLRVRWFCAALVLLALGMLAPAHDPIKTKVPSDLDLLPRDTFMVMHFRTGALWQRFGVQTLMARLERMEENPLEEVEKELGFPLTAIDRYTMVMLSEDPPKTVSLLTLNQPVNRVKVLDTILNTSRTFVPAGQENQPPRQPERQEKQIKGRTVYVMEDRFRTQALCFLSDRLFLFGDSSAVTAALEVADAPEAGPFATQVRKLAQAQPGLIAMNLENLPTSARREFETAPFILPTLVQAKSCFLTVAPRQGLEVKATVHFPTEGQAATARKEFTEGLKQLQAVVPLGIQELAHMMVESPDAPEHFYAFMKAFEGNLQKVQVDQEGTTVHATFRHAGNDQLLGNLVGDMTLGVGLLGSRAATTFQQVGDVLGQEQPARVRADKAQGLQKIAAAFEAYRAKHGHYPPAAIYGKDGTPLLSWRVALLPYLGEEQLFKEFKLDEPWYSKHNRPLLKKMPLVYGTSIVNFVGRTPFRLILGPGAAYEGKEGVNPSDLKDGPGQTLLVVEDVRYNNAGWTRPEGYRFGPEWPLPRMTSGEYSKGFYALFGDGKVRFVKHDVDEKTFRAMITKSGGEKVEEKELGEMVK